jgi:1,4-dihydroxy-2-naphthoate octaprenyltransferase
MEHNDLTPSQEILRITHPWVLAFSFLTYALGSGIANYLGASIRWSTYLIGQATVLLLLLSSYFLQAYFDRTSLLERPRVPGEPPRLMRSHLFAISATALTGAAALTVLLRANGALGGNAFLVLGLIFFLAMAYALPPLRLGRGPYGDLVSAILLANLIPAQAFLLLYGGFHRLLGFLTFPLTLLVLASLLALRMPHYAADLHAEQRNMLTSLGWQRGINLHNLLVLIGFLALGLAALAGLPWNLTWPGLLGLPLGLFQIVQMQAIGNGAPPRWRLLTITAAATLALTVYFVNLALWTF